MIWGGLPSFFGLGLEDTYIPTFWLRLGLQDGIQTGQNSGPPLGPLNTRCRIVKRSQKRSIILATTHMETSEIYMIDSHEG